MSTPQPLRAVAGQPFRPSASTWNSLVDLLRRPQEFGDVDRRHDGIVAKVKNNAGDVPRGGILAIGAAVFDYDPETTLAELPEFCVLGDAPNVPGDVGRFCVTLEPIGSGGVGLAVFKGLCLAKVDVTSADHRYADIFDGEGAAEKLVSRPIGFARIIARANDVGEQYAWIDLGHFATRFYSGVLDDALYAGDTATVSIDSGQGAPASVEAECPILPAGLVIPVCAVEVVPQPHTDVWRVTWSAECAIPE